MAHVSERACQNEGDLCDVTVGQADKWRVMQTGNGSCPKSQPSVDAMRSDGISLIRHENVMETKEQ